MKATDGQFSPLDCAVRVDEILEAADANYEETDNVPSRDRLTFTNGFYAYCTAVFVDIRESSQLPDKYKRPTLAKIYRSCISEAVAVLNAAPRCVELNIHGDAVWGVFATPMKSDIDVAFDAAVRLRSLTDLLNCRYRLEGIDPLRTGVGIDYGRALMIKAGHKRSAVNEVV